MPFTQLIEKVKRISEDCSSSECAYRNRTCPRVSHYLLSLPDSSIKLSTELASPRVHLDTTAHHAPIIWLGTQSQMDRWRIELHTVCIPTSVLCVINTRPLSDLMISALPFSLLSTIFTLNRFTLRFRYCVVHGETGIQRPSCLYIPRSVERLVNQHRPFGHPVRPRTGFQY